MDMDDDNYTPNRVADGADHLLDDVHYMRAVADMGTRLTRILSGGTQVQVKLSEEYPAPAWQDKNEIYLSRRQIAPMCVDPGDEKEVLPMLTGLLLHEYGHLDFTPKPDNPTWSICASRSRSICASRGQDAGTYVSHVRHTLNALEDQRQELIVATKYPRARSYFRLLILRSMLRLIKDSGKVPAENYGLYYGRRHIVPASIIRSLRAAFAAKYGEANTTSVEQQIDEYCALSLTTPAALTRSWDIAEQVWNIIQTKMQTDRPDCLRTGSIGARVSKREQDALSKQGQEILAQVDAARDESHDQDDGGSSNMQGSGSDGDDPDSGGHSDMSGGDGAGGDREELAPEDKPDTELADMIRSAMDKSYQKVEREAGERSAEIRARISGVEAAKLARVLSDISTDLAPTDYRRERSGRLDVRRLPALVASGGKETRVFHRPQRDLRDDAVMGVHVVIDSSGSMMNRIRVAIDAAHTIAKASDIAGHFVKVSTFDTDTRVVKDWNDTKWKRYGSPGGGTDIQPVLDGMLADFRRINTAEGFVNNVVFIVTDGGFDSPWKAEQSFKDLSRRGIHIFVIGIEVDPCAHTTMVDGVWQRRPYSVEGTIRIDHVRELEPELRGLMKRLAVNIAHNVRLAHV